MKKTLLIILFLLMTAMLFAGPFGMEFGWTLQEIEESGAYAWMPTRQGSITSYYVSPSKPHSMLSYYIVFIDEEYGLFEVRACSNECYSEYQIRNVYNMLQPQLSSVYGEPEEYDEISWDSDWEGSENFIRSILYGDRTLLSMWTLDHAGIESGYVFLGVLPIDADSAYVCIDYYSEYFDKVMEKYNASEASVL